MTDGLTGEEVSDSSGGRQRVRGTEGLWLYFPRLSRDDSGSSFVEVEDDLSTPTPTSPYFAAGPPWNDYLAPCRATGPFRRNPEGQTVGKERPTGRGQLPEVVGVVWVLRSLVGRRRPSEFLPGQVPKGVVSVTLGGKRRVTVVVSVAAVTTAVTTVGSSVPVPSP